MWLLRLWVVPPAFVVVGGNEAGHHRACPWLHTWLPDCVVVCVPADGDRQCVGGHTKHQQGRGVVRASVCQRPAHRRERKALHARTAGLGTQVRLKRPKSVRLLLCSGKCTVWSLASMEKKSRFGFAREMSGGGVCACVCGEHDGPLGWGFVDRPRPRFVCGPSMADYDKPNDSASFSLSCCLPFHSRSIGILQ